MSKLFSASSIACAFLSTFSLGATPAQALSGTTFVSGKGNDSGTCADPANPCRSFQFAIDQTLSGGAVQALDPADYGRTEIRQSISITGVEGAGINSAGSDAAITIDAGRDDVINLSHLILDGLKAGIYGIWLISAGSLTVTHCTVQNFEIGIYLDTGTGLKFLIADTVASDNGLIGIVVEPPFFGGDSTSGTLDHVVANKNLFGVELGAYASVTAVDSLANENGAVDQTGRYGSGFAVNAGQLFLNRSTALGNLGSDVFVFLNRGVAYTAGNNYFRAVHGTLTNLGTQ